MLETTGVKFNWEMFVELDHVFYNTYTLDLLAWMTNPHSLNAIIIEETMWFISFYKEYSKHFKDVHNDDTYHPLIIYSH